MPLALAIPDRDEKASVTVETRPKQVREWLDLLPMGNAAETAAALRDALAAQNRSKLADDTRLKLLELFRPPILTLTPALCDQFAGQALPLPERHRHAAELARALHAELANGYKILLMETGSASRFGFGFGGGRQLPLIAQRAMASLAEVLHVSYLAYAPVPAGVWLEMNQIFSHAIDENIPDEMVADGERGISVAATFKQALLIALANPHRLMHGEVARVRDYLERFGNLAQLMTAGATSSAAGFFVAHLENDAPPKPMAHLGATAGSGADILLSALELARLLHQQVAKLEQGNAPKTLGLPDFAREPAYVDLLRRLLKFWAVAPKRIFNRQRKEGSMELAVGLRALQYHLNGGVAYAMPKTTSSTSGIEASHADEAPADTTRTVVFPPTPCHIINESAGGVSLARDPKSATQLRVGEVIGMRPAAATTWTVAVVRWAHSSGPEHLEFGVQMLAPIARPAAIMPTISATNTEYQPALLIPEVSVLKQAARILAPRGSYQEMREYYLEASGTTTTVRAAKLIEQTAAFELFEFLGGGAL